MSKIGRQRHLRQWVVKVFDLLVKPDEPPARKAASFASGVLIGCLPLYGLHLLLSAMVARLFRLSLVRIYLGAHINNPLSAAALLYVEIGIGGLILGKPWPTALPSSLASIHLAALGMALAVGSVAVGLALAALTAVATLRLARAWESEAGQLVGDLLLEAPAGLPPGVGLARPEPLLLGLHGRGERDLARCLRHGVETPVSPPGYMPRAGLVASGPASQVFASR